MCQAQRQLKMHSRAQRTHVLRSTYFADSPAQPLIDHQEAPQVTVCAVGVYSYIHPFTTNLSRLFTSVMCSSLPGSCGHNVFMHLGDVHPILIRYNPDLSRSILPEQGCRRLRHAKTQECCQSMARWPLHHDPTSRHQATLPSSEVTEQQHFSALHGFGSMYLYRTAVVLCCP